jgi:hypothetical protein
VCTTRVRAACWTDHSPRPARLVQRVVPPSGTGTRNGLSTSMRCQARVCRSGFPAMDRRSDAYLEGAGDRRLPGHRRCVTTFYASNVKGSKSSIRAVARSTGRSLPLSVPTDSPARVGSGGRRTLLLAGLEVHDLSDQDILLRGFGLSQDSFVQEQVVDLECEHSAVVETCHHQVVRRPGGT